MKQFKTFDKKVIPDVVDYIKGYINNHENVDIIIGCDSQSYGNKKTIYGVVIVLYTKGKGGHVICNRETKPKEKNTPVRLLEEVWRAVEIAQFLTENGLPKPKYIDIDLNNDPKCKSNSVLKQAVGMVEGMGYKARYKHGGAMTSYTANYLVRI